jgi:hypothetical protein
MLRIASTTISRVRLGVNNGREMGQKNKGAKLWNASENSAFLSVQLQMFVPTMQEVPSVQSQRIMIHVVLRAT